MGPEPPQDALVRIVTERLLLVACAPELAEALQANRGRAEEIVGAALPDGWPDEELSALLPIVGAWGLGFGVWIAVEQAQSVVVGSAGFQGGPQDGAVELGFGIHESHRNAGYATEAAGALVAWALRQSGVDEVTAQCERSNAASIRVLEKAGLQRNGERGPRLLWSARPPSG